MTTHKTATLVQLNPAADILSSVAKFKAFLDIEWDSRNSSHLYFRVVNPSDHDEILEEAFIKRERNANGKRTTWKISRTNGETFRVWGLVTWFNATRKLLAEGNEFQLAIGDLEITFVADRRNRNTPDPGSITGERGRAASKFIKSKNIIL